MKLHFFLLNTDETQTFFSYVLHVNRVFHSYTYDTNIIAECQSKLSLIAGVKI